MKTNEGFLNLTLLNQERQVAVIFGVKSSCDYDGLEAAAADAIRQVTGKPFGDEFPGYSTIIYVG